MANQFYVEQSDRSYQSAVTNETINAGELTHDDGDGLDVLVFADLDADDPGHIGLALYDYVQMVAQDDDAIANEQYASGVRARYAPWEGGAILRVRTPEDNSTDPAPTIGHKTVVGVVDASALSGSAGEFQGRIVEEGYQDNANTTFNRSSNNFVAIGTAYRPAKQAGNNVNAFDEPIRVQLYDEPKESQ